MQSGAYAKEEQNKPNMSLRPIARVLLSKQTKKKKTGNMKK